MEFAITESVSVDGLELVITLSVSNIEYFSSIQDHVLSTMSKEIGETFRFIDAVTIEIESETHNDNFTDIIPGNGVDTYITLMIETLEEDEEYELCATFLKIKERYNSLTNEK